MKIQLKRSNVLESGAAKQPTTAQMEYGELAVNYNSDDPAIFIKDSSNNIIRISGVGNIADDGLTNVPDGTVPPTNAEPGNLWFNSEDGRLYIYYDDGDSEQWVDASPDSWDPSSMPDLSNPDPQPGSLDDRYVNITGDNMTGNLTLGGDKITFDASAGGGTFSSNIVSSGNFVINGAEANKGFFTRVGNSGDFGCRIVANGAASFASNNIAFETDGSARFAGIIETEGTRGGFISAQVPLISSDSSWGVWSGKNYVGDTTSRINGDGSAEFAGNITSTYTGTANSFQATGNIDGSSAHFRSSVTNNGSASAYHLYCDAADGNIVSISTDGSATFAGTVTADSFVVTGGNGGGPGDGGDLHVTGDLTVDGTSEFKSDIQIGDDVSNGTTYNASGIYLDASGTLTVADSNTDLTPNNVLILANRQTSLSEGQNVGIRFDALNDGGAVSQASIEVYSDKPTGLVGGSRIVFKNRRDASVGASSALEIDPFQNVILSSTLPNSTAGSLFLEHPNASIRIFGSGNEADNPNVKINADGSASFAGTIERNGPPNTTSFFSNSPANNTNGAHFIGKNGDTDVCILNADGSAEFAGDIVSGTYAVNEGYARVSNGQLELGRTADNANNGYIIGTTYDADGNANQNLYIGADGSASFADRVDIGSSDLDDNVALKLMNNYAAAGTATLYVQNFNDAGQLWSGRTGGNLETSKILADGSATFTGRVVAGEQAHTGNGLFVSNTSSSAYTTQLVNYDASGYTFASGSSTTPTITFKGDGSAEFAERIDVGGTSNTATAFTATNGSSNSASIYGRNNIGQKAPVFVAADSTADAKATIYNDGSAEFAGQVIGDSFYTSGSGSISGVYAGAINTALTDRTGAHLSAAGTLDIQQLAGSTDPALKIWQGDTECVSIKTDGSAEFAGDIAIGDRTYMGSGYGGAYIAANTLSGGTLFLYKSRTASAANDGNSFLRFYSAPDESTPKTEKIGFRSDGSAWFKGNVTSDGTIGFNLEPDNDANYTTTTDADGNESRVYNGPTLDVKDRLRKADAALQTLKTAAAAAVDFAELKAAIATALADI